MTESANPTTDTSEDVTLPEATTSRLWQIPDPAPDDFTSADDRIAAFWRKKTKGRIETRLVAVNERELEVVRSAAGAVVSSSGTPVRYTVLARVWLSADDPFPTATAHATRGSDDPDPITAAFPQETAETAAVSRALRYAGIKVQGTKKWVQGTKK